MLQFDIFCSTYISPFFKHELQLFFLFYCEIKMHVLNNTNCGRNYCPINVHLVRNVLSVINRESVIKNHIQFSSLQEASFILHF